MRHTNTCNRCGYVWMSGENKPLPKRCADCNSPYWNKERKRPVKPVINLL